MTEISDYSLATQLIALCKLGGVTPRMFEALFPRFGSTEKLIEASAADLESFDDLSAETAARVTAARDHLEEARALEENLSDREIHSKTRFDKDFPHLLFELNDPPPLLFVRGSLPDPNKRTVTLIGSSNASNDGIQMTTRLARTFVEADVQIISSLHGGIDTAAHLGSKTAGGKSFAIIDEGFDQLAGADVMPVAIDVAQAGGVISEYLPHREESEETIKETNRLLVGLGQAVVIPELYAESLRILDLLTFCNEIGKLVFVVIDPELGAFSDKKSLGHAIHNGAIPIQGYDAVKDIINALV
jgi:DNA processing protein